VNKNFRESIDWYFPHNFLFKMKVESGVKIKWIPDEMRSRKFVLVEN
jgi:hypothetical protein